MNSTISNLSSEEYHYGAPYSEYLSSTQLKWYKRSPKYAHYMMRRGKDKSTPAKELGSLFHDCMETICKEHDIKKWLEKAEVVEILNSTTQKPYGKKSKEYKEALEAYKTKHPEKIIIDKEIRDKVVAMAESLIKSDSATASLVNDAIQWGIAEASHFIEVNGVKCKYRPDLQTPDALYDYKTTSETNLTEDGLVKIVKQFDYSVSAAMYQFLHHELYGWWPKFIMIVVSTAEPYDNIAVCLDEWAYHYDKELGVVFKGPGALEFERLFSIHHRCVTKQEWPGVEAAFTTDNGLVMLHPPKYMYNDLNIEVNGSTDI